MPIEGIVGYKKLILDYYTKNGFRISPGTNTRNELIKICATGEDETERQKCFKMTKKELEEEYGDILEEMKKQGEEY